MSVLFEKYAEPEWMKPKAEQTVFKRKDIISDSGPGMRNSIFNLMKSFSGIVILLFIFGTCCIPVLMLLYMIIAAIGRSSGWLILVPLGVILSYIIWRYGKKGNDGSVNALIKALELNSEEELQYFLDHCEKASYCIYISDRQLIYIQRSGFSIYELNDIETVRATSPSSVGSHSNYLLLVMKNGSKEQISYTDKESVYDTAEIIKASLHKRYEKELSFKKYNY